MATMAAPARSAEQNERLFFLAMALAIAATVVGGFGSWALVGRSSFHAPWWVHVHAVSSMSWIAFYIAQNSLIFADNVALHRRFGRFGVGLAIWLILIDLALSAVVVAVHRHPASMPPSYLLALNWSIVVPFAILFFAAIRLRRRTDWHRRLMLCATICLMGPALGRILLLAQARTSLTFALFIMAWIAVGAVFDLVTRRRVHPAYLWGLTAAAVMGAAIPLLAGFPPFVALAERIAG